jgi:hypothetical protein
MRPDGGILSIVSKDNKKSGNKWYFNGTGKTKTI